LLFKKQEPKNIAKKAIFDKMKNMRKDWHAISLAEVFAKTKSGKEGLSDSEAKVKRPRTQYPSARKTVFQNTAVFESV